ncbi:MAG TPA: Shedu anti-phage system protein SduA domain-containing protein [Phycisphaerae bacterium]|nr:Shedu anti-phage system protein SduA domain-containing protein [Phycisphaerae bacterium]
MLAATTELSEKTHILPFFRARPNLSAFAGTFNMPVERIDLLGHELDIFGHFRCDLAVGNSRERAFSLIEFEDARPSSVFAEGTKYHDEWGKRFEHGFSQLVDWFWTIDDQRHSNDFARRFGGSDARFFGMLVTGRRAFVDSVGQSRLRWRSDSVSIGGHKIAFVTFDDLLEALEAKLQYLRTIADAGDLT